MYHIRALIGGDMRLRCHQQMTFMISVIGVCTEYIIYIHMLWLAHDVLFFFNKVHIVRC